MSFHTIDYLLFLPLVVLAFFAVPRRWRWVVLLAASHVFYMSWRIEFMALLWFTTLVDYFVALGMGRTVKRSRRRVLMAISLCANLGLLIYFKYTGLFVDSWRAMTQDGQFQPHYIILPLGISFYTFQTLGYTIDIYRGKREPERHLGYFAVYVMYFPQLLAGPIERPGKLLPQLRERHAFDWVRAQAACFLMLVGYFKKLVIADRLAESVPAIMASPEDFSPIIVFLGAIGNIYRYYADLSGYADIAIGSSLLMGIRLSQNFNRPFAAPSIAIFWNRWHITVTTWFRDYVYLPIVRSTKGPLRKPLATILTTLIIATWHGAQWVWIITGLLAGLVMVLETMVRRSPVTRAVARSMSLMPGIGPRRTRLLGDTLNRIVLWAFLLLLGSLVNAPSWDHGMRMWAGMARLPEQLLSGQLSWRGIDLLPITIYLIPATVIALETFQYFDARRPVFERVRHWPRIWSWSFVYAIFLGIIVLGSFTSTDFIYFGF